MVYSDRKSTTFLFIKEEYYVQTPCLHYRSLSIFTICLGQWHIDENFDNITTLPAGWTIHDDGDGMVWRNLNNATHAHSGTEQLCDNYLPNQNADWLITPQLNIAEGDSLIFYTRSG